MDGWMDESHRKKKKKKNTHILHRERRKFVRRTSPLVYFVATKWVQTVSHKRILQNNTREQTNEKNTREIRSLARTHNYFVHGKLQDNDNSNKLNGLAFFCLFSCFLPFSHSSLFIEFCACVRLCINVRCIQCVLDHWIKLIPMEFSTKAQLLQLPLFS